ALAQSLIDMQNKVTEAQNAIKSTLTGTTFESLADGLIDIFTKGTNAAEDFAANFEELMKKAILNSFKTSVLVNELQKFYDQFASYADSGNVLTEEEIS